MSEMQLLQTNQCRTQDSTITRKYHMYILRLEEEEEEEEEEIEDLKDKQKQLKKEMIEKRRHEENMKGKDLPH